MKEPIISIIVPIYNIEKYLKKCINSLINQTYKNIEILLINDGSTDSSLEICTEYAKKDNRIKVINKKNGGQGSARNLGLNICKGDYIAFVDGDDYIENNMYELMYKEIKKENADIVVCQVNMVSEEGEIVSANKNVNVNGNIEKGVDAIKRYISQGRWSCWDKLYKKDVIENIKFLECITCDEDNAVIIPILKNSNKMVTIDNYLYNYLVRENSTTTSKFSKKNFQGEYVWENVLNQAKEFKNSEIIELAKIRLSSCYIDLINESIRHGKENYSDEIKDIIIKLRKLECEQPIVKNPIKRYQIAIRIIKRSFRLYNILFDITEKLKG